MDNLRGLLSLIEFAASKGERLFIDQCFIGIGKYSYSYCSCIDEVFWDARVWFAENYGKPING